jgi:hypothetical protein
LRRYAKDNNFRVARDLKRMKMEDEILKIFEDDLFDEDIYHNPLDDVKDCGTETFHH